MSKTETLPIRKTEFILDQNKVKAELKNGMLYLTADIAEESQAKKVAIQSA